MRLHPTRLRLLWMMVAVVLAALVLAGETMRRRREYYQRHASISRLYAGQFRRAFETRSLDVFAEEHGPVFAANPALRLKWAEYYENLYSKYEHASWHPWECVPADPPKPEIVPPESAY
jgi:hypothetical protein